MPADDVEFAQLLERIRAGDQQAAAQLVARYEPIIRREIRLRLNDRNLARAFDSVDICQSVLASFFIRTAAGEFQIDSAARLVSLLVNMARNKFVTAARREYRQRRDLRRRSADAAADFERIHEPASVGPEAVDNRDLMQRIYERLTPEELRISRLRCGGAAWEDVAAELGGTAQSRRVQYSRALERVADELGLDLAR